MRARSWVAALLALAFSLSLGAVARADIAAGSEVDATLQQTISTNHSKVGDPVLMKITSVGSAPLDPELQGATIRGHVAQVTGPTPTKKAHVDIAFDTLTLADGRTFPFPAKIVSLKTKKTAPNIPQAAGEVLAGMIVGNIIGKGIGTGAGGPVGAAGGAVYASAMAVNVRIPQNSIVKMKTTDAIALSAPHPQAT